MAFPWRCFQCTEFTRPDIERLVRAINAVAVRPISESQVSLRFRREWTVLRDEVGRIDISGEDAEEERAPRDEALDVWLDDTEYNILDMVAWSGHEQPLGGDGYRSLGFPRTTSSHSTTSTNWSRRRFLHEHLNVEYPSTYSATRRGRAYIVENQA